MGLGGGSPTGGIKSDINVTPLVDVVLVLLIIFMVITPMLQRGKPVKLPRAQQPPEEQTRAASEPIVISVTADKAMFIESDQVDEAGFLTELRKKLQAKPGQKVLLKGDQRLSFDDVRKVMNLARKAGAKGVGLGVEEVKAE